MEKNKAILLIAAVLAVGLVLGSLTGQVSTKSCRDRDGDGFYAKAGCGTLADCNDADSRINPGAVDICQDGIDQNCNGIDEACTTISTTVSTIPFCTDSDNGQNIFVKGTATDSTGSYVDYCFAVNITGASVNEYYCNSIGAVQAVTIGCPSGYSCIDGACLPA